MLQVMGHVNLPKVGNGGFDHADVCLTTGHVYVANTAADQVDMFDGEALTPIRSISNCAYGSGVLYGSAMEWMFAAARGSGKLLVLDAMTGDLLREVEVGPKPNGIAWDPTRRRALVADVESYDARCVDPSSREIVAMAPLLGRPRWCVYDAKRDCYWVNIMNPFVVQGLAAGDLTPVATLRVGARGPHGLALDPQSDRLFIACDDARLIVINAVNGVELADTQLAGSPDAIWLNERFGRLYVGIGDPGCVQVVDTTTFAVAETIVTEMGAHTLTFDELRQRLYVFLPNSSRAVVYAEGKEGPAVRTDRTFA
ncbi:hypothetical protein LLE49_22140 [Alicyclobacillus tolerans]|uniref:YncE family protein n=1 Tax=Alicyclobacillus tolerans TaxID=90970 RepID=UPI001F388565|nr:hypothetical protein [Alicyclobacillus tolerans]MCF8567423.1 hypothetical protein [Alicyclobacillus tolerans]